MKNRIFNISFLLISSSSGYSLLKSGDRIKPIRFPVTVQVWQNGGLDGDMRFFP